MARADAVRAINPKLFDRGWSKVSGSASGGIGRRAQMVRAARGHAPAIFKPIRQGGCHTGTQLRAQLSYLTTKSSFILDSRGTHDGKKVLSPGEIERVARRFENQWNERHSPKLGHTSHLLMAFPVGTRTSEVREITREICERFFEGDGAQFDYIAAIHEDRAHPHAHIVLNRRSKDGEMFFLGRDHHFSYDSFREAMVEAAERHGLRLEATRRLDRGVLTRDANDVEIRKAQSEGRMAVERPRTGADLDHAVLEIARNVAIYRGLAAEASHSKFHDVADALSRAGEVLARGDRIQPDGVLYMSDEDAQFDELIDRFSQNIRQIEGLSEHASATERPVIERKLSDVLREVSHLWPIGDRSDTLHEPASRDGIYAAPNLVEARLDQLDDPGLKVLIAEAVRGAGIDSDAVLARMREGAGNAALEQQWLAQDLRAIAKEEQLDLRDRAQRDQAMDRLEIVHGKLGDILTEARVIRAVEDVEREEGARVSEPSTHRVSTDDVEGRRERRNLDVTAPQLAAALRQAADGKVDLTSDAARQQFVDQVNDRLTPGELRDLHRGDAKVLERITPNALEQLQLARAWLEATGVHANDPAMDLVLRRIVEERHGEDLKHSLSHGEKGITHG